MSLAETLIVTLGRSIANALVKRWLSKEPAQTLTSNLIDLAAKEGQRRFKGHQELQRVEQLGEHIAEQLRPLVENFRLLPNEREALIFEVATTLKEAEISAEQLLALQLDHKALARRLRKARPEATLTLSAAQTEHYEQLLDQAALAILKISAEFPSYQRLLDTRQLQEHAALIEVVNAILYRPAGEDAQFRNAYQRQIQRKLERAEESGAPRLEELSKDQSLSVAYVELKVTYPTAEDRDAPPQAADFLSHADRREGHPTERTCAASELLADTRRLVLRGEAGSGKTTLLQWLALRAAHGDFPKQMANWNDHVPFLIRLREYVNADFPTPEQFVEKLTSTIAGTMPHGWVHRQLEAGKALILVDGVDELPEAQRPAMLERLQDLLETYPLARYIVTSRPPALKAERWPEWNDWIAGAGFTEAALQPMSQAQYEAFIARWYQALPENTAQRAEGAAHLQRLLRQRPSLRRLATNPLLCALLCALHKKRGDNLPTVRLQLYRESVEILLESRDTKRGVPVNADYPKLSLDQQLALMRSFAGYLLRNGYTDIDIAQADQHFANRLAFMSLPPEVTGERVRRFFVERTNLLHEPVVGRVDFRHRTFLEYLAADQIVEDDEFGLLKTHTNDDQWREVVILAAGLARRNESEDLLTWLLEQGPLGSLLAVACLETVVELSPAVREAVLTRARELLPPQDSDQVTLYAAAGPSLVPLLAPDPAHDAQARLRCIEVLGRIGGEAARQQLARYAQDYAQRKSEEHDLQETHALATAWANFDPETYAREVLTYLPELWCEGVPFDNLGPFATLTQLQTLILKILLVSNLSPLANLTKLQRLALMHMPVDDLTPLRTLTQLQRLDLLQTPVSNLRPLSPLTQLQALSLISTQISDLHQLANLTQLQSLDLSGSPVSDLSPLANLRQLQSLVLGGAPVSDLSPLAALTQLQRLDLGYTRVSDLSPLTDLTQLQCLDLGYTRVSDLSPLTDLTQLQHLDLPNTPVSNLRPLAALTQLQRLDLKYTQVSDLSPLADLTQLQRLDLDRTQVSDLSPLTDLTQLQRLDLEGTQVSDLSSLTALTQLHSLALRHTQVSNLRPLAALPALRYVLVDKHIDITPLRHRHELQITYELREYR